VGQRFDLNDPNSPTYKFEESQFRIGYGMYAIDFNVAVSESGTSFNPIKTEMDVQKFIWPETFIQDLDSNSIKFINTTSCDTSDLNLQFLT
jgi:hypothetical protein